jgi:hypothetical protein
MANRTLKIARNWMRFRARCLHTGRRYPDRYCSWVGMLDLRCKIVNFGGKQTLVWTNSWDNWSKTGLELGNSNERRAAVLGLGSRFRFSGFGLESRVEGSEGRVEGVGCGVRVVGCSV